MVCIKEMSHAHRGPCWTAFRQRAQWLLPSLPLVRAFVFRFVWTVYRPFVFVFRGSVSYTRNVDTVHRVTCCCCCWTLERGKTLSWAEACDDFPLWPAAHISVLTLTHCSSDPAASQALLTTPDHSNTSINTWPAVRPNDTWASFLLLIRNKAHGQIVKKKKERKKPVSTTLQSCCINIQPKYQTKRVYFLQLVSGDLW